MRVWVPLAVATTLVCILMYVTLEQSYRSALNDPQIQIAEDAALRIVAGANPQTLVTKESVDIAASLSPWLAVYDAAGTPVVSTGLLDGDMPRLPSSVFEDLRSRSIEQSAGYALAKESRISWEPMPDVRQAIVIVEAADHFVVSGRSMREADDRIWQMETTIAFGWVITLLATLLAVWLGSYAQDFITYSRQ